MRTANALALNSENGESIKDKYINVLKEAGGWITIAEWAQKFSTMYPELFQRAEEQAAAQTKPSTGLREIAARMSSGVSAGTYKNIEIDESERPKKVRWISKEDSDKLEEVAEDEELTRAEIEKLHCEAFSQHEEYRHDEFVSIADTLNFHFGTDFEVDHAKALLNRAEPGRHHPDNFQILTKNHNRKKGNRNWKRLTLEEQINYINSVLETQKIVADKMEVDLHEEVLLLLINRLKQIYGI